MWTTNGLINYAYDGLYDDGTDSDLTLTMTSIVELNASQQVRFRLRQPLLKLLYICVSFWLLVHESRDLSQAETNIGGFHLYLFLFDFPFNYIAN